MPPIDAAALDETIDRIVSGVGGSKSAAPTTAGPLLTAEFARAADPVAANRDTRHDARLAWELVVRAIGEAIDRGDDLRSLTIALHLIARGRDRTDSSRIAPYDDLEALAKTVGLTADELLGAAMTKPGARYAEAIGLRRTYAGLAVGEKANRQSFMPGKRTGVDPVVAAVRRALAGVLEPFRVEQAVRPADAVRPTRRRRRTLVALAVIACAGAVIAASVLAGSVRGGAGNALGPRHTATPSESVTIHTHTAKDIGETPGAYWVPATAPIDRLIGADGGCGGGTVGAWLDKYGEPLNGIPFTIQNTGDSRVIARNVVAHGRVRAATPGLWFTCSIGGGDVSWDSLTLDMRDRAVAQFGDERANTYFSHSIDDGSEAGAEVWPRGDLDFDGSITVDIVSGTGTKTLDLPEAHGSDTLPVRFHGTPAGRMLTISTGAAGSLVCEDPSGATIDDCTPTKIRQRLAALWGAS